MSLKLTEEQWRSDLEAIRYYATIQPGYAEYWAEHRQIFRASYAEAIDGALAD